MTPIYRRGCFSVYPVEDETGRISRREVVVAMGSDTVLLTLNEVSELGLSIVKYMQGLKFKTPDPLVN